jgi:hypothetical protein
MKASMINLVFVAMLCIVWAISGVCYASNVYQFTPIGGGTFCTDGFGINNSGVVVGCGGNGTAALWQGGNEQTFQIPGANWSELLGINDNGQIVGDWTTSSGQYGFITSVANFGTITEITPMAYSTIPMGINNAGTIVGYYGSGRAQGFLRQPDGSVTTIDYPGVFSTAPSSINNLGVIVGKWNDSSNNRHGWIRDTAGNFTSFDVPNSSGTYIIGINDLGQMCGYYIGSDSLEHGFVCDALGNVTTVDFPGAIQTEIRGINNSGEITGIYCQNDSSWQNGFTASPTPEPATLLLLGLGGLALLRKRRM